ncbi:FecR family protein [Parapedobacter sp.]
MDRTTHILHLLNKYRQHALSIDELRILQQWASTHPAYRKLLDDFAPDRNGRYGIADPIWVDYAASGRSLSFEDLLDRIALNKRNRRKKSIAWLSAAASIIMVGLCSLYFFQQQTNDDKIAVVPGSKQAVILTDNGGRQEVTEERGLVVTNEGMFYADGQAVDGDLFLETQHLNLVVPKGGEYQITLSDGTRVWLNSNSTLKFPQEFSPEERLVEISGEAYFEVSHDSQRPFIVKSNYQEITVLGTTFNIKAYSEDGLNTTTLIEGSVRVRGNDSRDQLQLLPGEAAIAGKSRQLKIQTGDVEQAISWKKGEFNFNRTPFEEVAKQIARWYNLELEYRGQIPQEYFTGQLSRAVDFDIVLAFLKDSGINLELVANKLIIQ